MGHFRQALGSDQGAFQFGDPRADFVEETRQSADGSIVGDLTTLIQGTNDLLQQAVEHALSGGGQAVASPFQDLYIQILKGGHSDGKGLSSGRKAGTHGIRLELIGDEIPDLREGVVLGGRTYQIEAGLGFTGGGRRDD